MRISDWSSDVCSSDLIGDAAAVGADLRIGGDREVEQVGAGETAVGSEPRAAHGGARHGGRGFGRSGGFGRRSEEHTSELQSLMRISYAVFCLKKKIQQNEYNTSDKDIEQNNNNKQ